MAKKLVIVESPAKAKTINKILGKDFIVSSSVGHIRDLPERSLGVDIEHDFQPEYVVAKGKKAVIAELRKAAKECDVIYLAPDPDREGEAIAWHIEETLKPGCEDKTFLRVQYNEITPRAVKAAFESPGAINMNRVDAQQARRILDRIVGYKVSPVLWRRLSRGLSAGRVQSVALRLVCEREALIEKFVAEPYWVMGARVRKQEAPLEPFAIKLVKVDDAKAEIHAEEVAAGILADLEGRKLRVREIATRTVKKRSPPPFITSTLQQAGSSFCSFSPQRTMSLAQQLYEGVDLGEGPAGLITYMRTDCFRISQEAQSACREYVTKTYGAEYVPETPNVYRSRAGAQEAHEAIRPTDVTRTPQSLRGHLDAAQLKLYRLIWERFVASQMAAAELLQRTVKIEAEPEGDRRRAFLFQAGASDVVFAGYMKVTGVQRAEAAEGEEGAEEQSLPPMREGEALDCLEWLSERKETKPPARFSEASLVRELEQNGVGRPSTYASIISTLTNRKYVQSEKRSLAPTSLGRQVNDLLVADLGELFDVGFTAAMEELLDEVERGEVRWTVMLADFYKRFEVWMANTQVPPADAGKVGQVLGLLGQVQTWAPEYKRGKRTYSDDKFVTSIREQMLTEGKKPISLRQLDALLKMVVRYRAQIPEVETVLQALGLGEALADPASQPPRETTVAKLASLAKLELDERAQEFVSSLRARVEGGRRLTDAQLRALDNLVVGQSSRIEGFEGLRESFGLQHVVVEEDTTTPHLLKAMEAVTTWKEPVKRGKRVFDDREFWESLSRQFQTKSYLTPRQKAALQRMVARYHEQIPDYERVAECCGLRKGSAQG